jgi:predicted permease
MPTLATIVPIFAIIALGAFARRRGFIPDTFLEPANRLVYYLAIPAMVFRAIAGATLQKELNPGVLLVTLVSVLTVCAAVFAAAYLAGVQPSRRGTLTQCAFHGNLGYIGFAVIFYYLGDSGLVRGSILAGFIMILQNLLAVVVLQIDADDSSPGGRLKRFAGRVLINPVILSALLAIAYAAMELPLPEISDRALKILGGLALPMALLLIGASLSFSLVRDQLVAALVTSFIKIVVMPALGCAVFFYFGYSSDAVLPAMILLAAPPATMTYVFATEMRGDKNLAVAAISVGTVGSSLSYIFWLQLLT